jgi:hypothetical protein
MINVADELLAICGALVGGARYGLKIRLPHALVMTFIFRKGTTLMLFDPRAASVLIVLILLFAYFRLEFQAKTEKCSEISF